MASALLPPGPLPAGFEKPGRDQEGLRVSFWAPAPQAALCVLWEPGLQVCELSHSQEVMGLMAVPSKVWAQVLAWLSPPS